MGLPIPAESRMERFIPYPASGSEIDRLLALTSHLGFDAPGAELEFPLLVEDYADLRRAMAGLPELHNYAIVHPGARAGGRRWATRNFAVVADALSEAGLTVVLTGTDEERGITADVAGQMRNLAFDLSGRTSLGALAVLIDGARVVVANDTGISHLAAARRTPSVIVFSGSDADRWAPADAGLHRVVAGRHPRSTELAVLHALDVARRSRANTESAA
jgi:ADP-heptose:LPS heptosyltransferase